jgi:hypothetical protein
MSYGSIESEYYRLVGRHAGKIPRADRPADLPVQQSTKLELIINLRTAKALGSRSHTDPRTRYSKRASRENGPYAKSGRGPKIICSSG